MSSHLAISYSSNLAASKSSAAGQATSTATDGLGFLGTLVDQLLAGDAGNAASQTVTSLTGSVDTAASAVAAASLSSIPEVAADSSQGLKLLKRLASELRGLQFQLSAGETPDTDELKMLSNTLDRLGKILGFSLTTEQSATISASETGNASNDIARPGTAVDSNTIVASLATIGTGLVANSPDSSVDSTLAPTTTDTAGARSAFADLTKALDAASAAVTPLSPALAQKLEAFANQLGAVADDPQALAALAGSTEEAAAAVSAALAKLAKPQRLFSEFEPLIQLSQGTQLPIAEVGRSPTLRAATDSAKRLALESVALTPSTLDTSSPALAPVAPARLSSDADSAAEASIIAADAADPEPAKAAPTSTSQTTTDATSSAAATTPQARALPAAYLPVANPINMGQVAFEMVHQVQNGLSRFSIRLDPAELGRIDVRMSVDQSGAVTARLTVDRAETLDLFQRDRSLLERALTGAGLDAGKTSLEFSLRQNPFTGSGDNRQSADTYTADNTSTVTAATDAADPVHSVTLYRGAATARGVNIFA